MVRIFLEALASFLVTRLGQAIIDWSARFRNQQEDPVPESETPRSQRDVHLYLLPDRDYLEAMVGDLLERQKELRDLRFSNKKILVITLLELTGMVLDLLSITLQNFVDPGQPHPKPPAGEPPSALSDDDDGPDIDTEVY